jgi:hypothetical protein
VDKVFHTSGRPLVRFLERDRLDKTRYPRAYAVGLDTLLQKSEVVFVLHFLRGGMYLYLIITEYPCTLSTRSLSPQNTGTSPLFQCLSADYSQRHAHSLVTSVYNIWIPYFNWLPRIFVKKYGD